MSTGICLILRHEMDTVVVFVSFCKMQTFLSPPQVSFIHTGWCLHSTVGQGTGGTAHVCQPDHTNPASLVFVTLTKEISAMNFPNTDSLLNAWQGKTIFWISRTLRSTVAIVLSAALHWDIKSSGTVKLWRIFMRAWTALTGMFSGCYQQSG